MATLFLTGTTFSGVIIWSYTGHFQRKDITLNSTKKKSCILNECMPQPILSTMRIPIRRFDLDIFSWHELVSLVTSLSCEKRNSKKICILSDTIFFSFFSVLACRGNIRKPNAKMRVTVAAFTGVVFGFFLGVSFPTLSLTKVYNLSPYHSITLW